MMPAMNMMPNMMMPTAMPSPMPAMGMVPVMPMINPMMNPMMMGMNGMGMGIPMPMPMMNPQWNVMPCRMTVEMGKDGMVCKMTPMDPSMMDMMRERCEMMTRMMGMGMPIMMMCGGMPLMAGMTTGK
jgi:hypothetical protein